MPAPSTTHPPTMPGRRLLTFAAPAAGGGRSPVVTPVVAPAVMLDVVRRLDTVIATGLARKDLPEATGGQ